jgi:hypothetical protein
MASKSRRFISSTLKPKVANQPKSESQRNTKIRLKMNKSGKYIRGSKIGFTNPDLQEDQKEAAQLMVHV